MPASELVRAVAYLWTCWSGWKVEVERRVVVVDAEAAAGVDVADVVAVFFEVGDEADDAGGGGGEGLDVADLRADVDADAGGVEPFGFCGGAVDGAGGVDVDAELVLAEAGGDVGVGVGEDVGVDAEGEAGAELEGLRRGRRGGGVRPRTRR